MKCIFGTPLPAEEVKKERSQGKKISELTLCPSILYHHYFFRTRYVRCRDIIRAFARVEHGESGDLPIHECSLILITADQKEHALHVDRKEYALKALDHMKTAYPHIKIGKI